MLRCVRGTGRPPGSAWTADGGGRPRRRARGSGIEPGTAGKRAELRGCLASLRVKAQAYAARGIAPALGAVADQADRLLASRPTPLEEAARLVADYETRLAGMIKGMR